MRQRLWLLWCCALLFMPRVGWAAELHWFQANSSGASHYATNGESTTLANTQLPMFSAGRVKNLYVNCELPPNGAGKQWDFYVNIDGSDSAVTCSLVNTDTTCDSGATSADYSAGALLTIHANPTNAPAAAFCTFDVAVTNQDDSTHNGILSMGNTTGANSADATFCGPSYSAGGGGCTGGTEAAMQFPLAADATFTGMAVKINSAPSNGSETFTLRKAGGDTAITCTISGANTTCSSSGSVAATAGDEIVVRYNTTTSPVDTRVRALSIEYSGAGQIDAIYRPFTTFPVLADSTMFSGPNNFNDNPNRAVGRFSQNGTVQNLRAEITTTSANSATVWFRTAASLSMTDSTQQTCVITAGNTSCTASGTTISVNKGDYYQIKTSINDAAGSQYMKAVFELLPPAGVSTPTPSPTPSPTVTQTPTNTPERCTHDSECIGQAGGVCCATPPPNCSPTLD